MNDPCLDRCGGPNYFARMSTIVETPKKVWTEADPEGEEVLPGFQYPIADLFKEWEW